MCMLRVIETPSAAILSFHPKVVACRNNRLELFSEKKAPHEFLRCPPPEITIVRLHQFQKSLPPKGYLSSGLIWMLGEKISVHVLFGDDVT
ncbi:hypothetical protein JTE90_004827 [Oedothorax gibbosus]|uniref:Uncharacterized protein n=1 Tax=Oedothorax gibbosus TaxID=931172 RepID=A0AAV6URN2_9ARAC|nr:hypothetical protein JTE90_004827 [Oedothorax gibbosus]